MKKKLTVLVALLLLVTVSVGGTLAWLATQTDPVTNTFTPSKVTTAVDEKTEGGVKSDVKIQNTGDTSAYIRATYVVNWVDSEGNIYAAQPVADTNYTVVLNVVSESDPWTQGADDGYYYCKTAIEPDSETPVLINSIAPKGAAPTGYTLQVTIIAEGIQSTGMDATGAQDAFDKAAK